MASETPMVDLLDVPASLDYAGAERETLAYWTEIDAFHESLRRSEGNPEFSFYDGPPFATGLPHYGHLLAGTIKDTVCRYAHQTGHHVTRRFGWDCHGLPIEYEIDKKLGISGRDDVLKLGIDKYNAECRSIVMRYSSEWEHVVSRMGRWIDFKNDYKTLNPTFMESVWWVFKEIYKKELVYEGYRVMPYSTACSTPLSNFEAGQNYKDVQDPAVVVSFPVVGDEDTLLLAWTTTPWTLPSNLALCVHPEMDYVKVKDGETGNVYVLMEARLPQLYPVKKGGKKKNKDKDKAAAAAAPYEVLEKFKGEKLKGLCYVPLFDYFADREGAFVVVADEYVTADSGTGIVHQAPAFGEDDFRVCLDAGLISKSDVPCPIDTQGCYTIEVPDFVGRHVKEADGDIMRELKRRGRLIHQATINHNYPFCWRSETPLIYRVVPSWFIDVPQLKERLLVHNASTYWVPDHVKTGRFHNWLADAREWCISRNRFWGTPLPIWRSDDPTEDPVVVGSIAELEELTGTTVTDLHRDSIDDLTFLSPKGNTMRRVDEVFDCWFESGSMPYAQKHYPFENADAFERDYFPADFIAEGLDQTRGWFYTLLVISTALFDQPPFKNLIVNGMVLAEDGKKMSKRLKNYPDPMEEVVEVLGADALRLYLITSPVVHGESLKFSKKGVAEIRQKVFNPWFNAYRFWWSYVLRLQDEDGVAFVPNYGTPTNVMDVYILSTTQSLVRYVRAEMDAYRLHKVVPECIGFINDLANWYVRLNRDRMKGRVSLEDARMSLSVLHEVLTTLCVLMAPFTPFIVEMMYQNLRRALPAEAQEPSVHFCEFPTVDESKVKPEVERGVGRMQKVIELARVLRDQNNRPTKFGCLQMVVVVADPTFAADVQAFEEYVRGEVNVNAIVYPERSTDYVIKKVSPNRKALGPKLGRALREVGAAIEALDPAAAEELFANGSLEIAGHVVEAADCDVALEPVEGGAEGSFVAGTDGDLVVLLDMTVTDELLSAYVAREVLNRVQRLRKSSGLEINDDVAAFVESDSELVARGLANDGAVFTSALGVPVFSSALWNAGGAAEFAREHHDLVIDDTTHALDVVFVKTPVVFSAGLADKVADVAAVATAAAAADVAELRSSGVLVVGDVTLNVGEDVALAVKDTVRS